MNTEPESSKSRIEGGKGRVKRNARWDAAKKEKTKQNMEYLWIPVEYEGEERPGVMLYDDKTEYRVALNQFYMQPIVEGLLVAKHKGEYIAQLYKIAYDPFVLDPENPKLEKETFTGTILLTDWNDVTLEGHICEQGKIVKSFAEEGRSKNSRNLNICDTTRVYYQTWYVSSDNAFTVVLSYIDYTVCTETGSSDSGLIIDPNVSSGSGGGWGYPWGPNNSYVPNTSLLGFNPANALINNGHDRVNFNYNLNQALDATGLANNILGWSLDKADALSKSIGGTGLKNFSPVLTVGVRSLGYVNLLLAGRQVLMAITSDRDISHTDWLNIAGGVLGGVAFILGGWVAVAAGGVSVGIAVYVQSIE